MRATEALKWGVRGSLPNVPRLGVHGDEAIHGVLDMMNAGVDYSVLQWSVPIHPTVSELIPTLIGDLRPG